MKKSKKKDTRSYHKVQKLAEGGPVKAAPPTFGAGKPTSWDYFRAGAADQFDDAKKVLRGDMTGSDFKNTKEMLRRDRDSDR